MLKRFSLVAATIATFSFSMEAQASTVTVDFDGLSGGTNVNVGGDLIADDLRIQNGNCNLLMGGSGPSCAALNRNEITTISRSSGLAFTLTSFWYQLIGANAELEVSYLDNMGGVLGTDFFSGPDDGNNEGGEFVLPSFSGEIFSVAFENPGDNPGNVRIDDLSVQIPVVSEVPLPAAGMLFLSGLGGLIAMRRRKRS